MDSPKQNRKSNNHPRLHKYLASCGLGSRRACEKLIAEGRVSVDGIVVREQGVCIDPACQAVCLDRRPVVAQAKIFLVLNKPRGFLCTSRDPQGRQTFLSLLPPLQARVFTVGRLDWDSEGLLLVTNDGDLAHSLMHPRHGVEKIYRVWTAACLTTEQEQRLRMGITSQGERLHLNDIKPVDTRDAKAVYEIRLVAGRNRHIRRMFEALGITILRLQRVAIGPLALDGLRVGVWRHLKDEEVRALRQYAIKPLQY
ncbi:MAG: pseudouridine synthase [Kiritimatiellae bacterium]|nr:pseudouridine synthase [Kiritimatiellia bacterium]